MLMLLLVILSLMMMLRSVDAVNETLPCKVKSNIVFCSKLQSETYTQVVGVSMDTTNSIFDWLDSNPDLKEFNVPLMSDRCRWLSQVLSHFVVLHRDAEISRAFGVIQRGYSAGQVCIGC